MTKNSTAPEETSPSELIDQTIKALGDWRGETLARLRALIRQASQQPGEKM